MLGLIAKGRGNQKAMVHTASQKCRGVKEALAAAPWQFKDENPLFVFHL